MAQHNGYAGKILKADLSTEEFRTTPTENYADRFLGGRGIALKIHWDKVPAEGEATDPENRLVMITGPVYGVPGWIRKKMRFTTLRGWDVATGLQTKDKLEALDLKDVADGLDQEGWIV